MFSRDTSDSLFVGRLCFFVDMSNAMGDWGREGGRGGDNGVPCPSSNYFRIVFHFYLLRRPSMT